MELAFRPLTLKVVYWGFPFEVKSVVDSFGGEVYWISNRGRMEGINFGGGVLENLCGGGVWGFHFGSGV